MYSCVLSHGSIVTVRGSHGNEEDNMLSFNIREITPHFLISTETVGKRSRGTGINFLILLPVFEILYMSLLRKVIVTCGTFSTLA